MEKLRITAEKKEKVQFSGTEESAFGNSLVVQRLGLCAFTARVCCSLQGKTAFAFLKRTGISHFEESFLKRVGTLNCL